MSPSSQEQHPLPGSTSGRRSTVRVIPRDAHTKTNAGLNRRRTFHEIETQVRPRVLVSMVESTNLGHFHNPTECERLSPARDRRVFVACQVRSRSVVQVDNPAPIKLRRVKSVIRGIRGSVVLSPCMSCPSGMGSPCVGAGSRRSRIVEP
jgi:hypothetical protein